MDKILDNPDRDRLTDPMKSSSHQITRGKCRSRACSAIATLILLSASSGSAKITVWFGVDAITVNQRVGAIQVPVHIAGESSNGYVNTPSMAYYTQDGSAVFGRDYSYTRDYWGNGIRYHSGDSRIKYLTFSIKFTESIPDRTFTILLDPSDTGFLGNTNDADAGAPAFVSVTILGVSPSYILLKQSIQRLNLQIRAAKKLRNPRKRAMKVRALSRKKVILQSRLNRIV